MTFRVTNSRANELLIDRILGQQAKLEKIREEVSSGIRVKNASDNPSRASEVSRSKMAIERIDRHQERIALGISMFEAQEVVLSSAQNALTRAKELATQGANATTSAEQRERMAEEVFSLREQLVSLANSTYRGRHLYGGVRDDEPPFALAAAPGYAEPAGGSGPEVERFVFSDLPGTEVSKTVHFGQGSSERVSSSGREVFEKAIAGLEMLGRSLDGYSSTRDAQGLPDGGGAAFSLPEELPAQIEEIREAMQLVDAASKDDLGAELTSVGSRMERLMVASETLDAVKLSEEAKRASLQDSDPFEAISTLGSLETGLQALVSTGSKIGSMSLMNYL